MSKARAEACIKEALNYVGWEGEEHTLKALLYDALTELEKIRIIEIAFEAKQ